MSKYADLVLQSNCVFTAVGEEPFAGFVAVAGSKILCVGHGAPDGAILGPNTKVLYIYETCRRDAQGRVINRHAITDLEFSDPADLERMWAPWALSRKSIPRSSRLPIGKESLP